MMIFSINNYILHKCMITYFNISLLTLLFYIIYFVYFISLLIIQFFFNMDSKGAVKKVRSFQNAWLEEDDFKRWLAPHPTENKALFFV